MPRKYDPNHKTSFRCPRCRQKARKVYFWGDGTYTYICDKCKKELDNGAPRKLDYSLDESLI